MKFAREMNAPPTPYLWQYQPQTGTAAGARQDYGSVTNWFASDNSMYHRVQQTNRNRNLIDEMNETTVDPYYAASFNNWDSSRLTQPAGSRYAAMTQRPDLYTSWDRGATSDGAQLSGARPSILSGGALLPPSEYSLNDGREYRKLTRDGHPFPVNWMVKENGMWVPIVDRAYGPADMQGGAANATSTYPTLLPVQPAILAYRRPGQQLQGGGVVADRNKVTSLLTERSRVPRSQGMTAYQFMNEFPPVVYDRPFSADSPAEFPKEFNPLFEPREQVLASSLYSLQYR